MTKPFDPFTQPPRNKREFGVAMDKQAEALIKKAETAGEMLGFVVTKEYLVDTVGITDPVKAIELLWRSLPYSQFKIWLDGRTGNFVVETFPPAAPQRKSSIIMPGRHLNG